MKRKILLTVGLFLGLYLGKWLIDSSGNENIPVNILYKKDIDAALKDLQGRVNDTNYSQDDRQRFARVIKAIKEKKIVKDGDNWLIIMSEQDVDDNELIYVGRE